MAKHNDLEVEQSGAKVLTIAATATLTVMQLEEYKIIRAVHASSAIALTLPAGGARNKGMIRYICCGGAAAVTIINTLGYGTVGSGGDTMTLAQGEVGIIVSDGVDWHAGTLATGDIA